MATISKRAFLANIFGTFGYISCLLQWLLATLLYLPLLLDSDWFKAFILPEKTEQVAPVATSGDPSPLLIIVASVFTVIMIGVTIFILLRAPLSIARSGKAVTTKTATTIVPLVTHRKLSPAKKRQLTSRLVKIIKFCLVLVPFLLCLLSVLLPTTLPFDVIVFVAAWLAIGSLMWFSAQYLTARWLGVRLDKLV